MQKIAVALACLALSAYGSRVRSRPENDEVNPMSALASMLLASNPEGAFVANPAARGVSPFQPVRMARGSPVMMDNQALAKKCIEEGCPVDTVQELIAALKADDATNPGTLNALIADLEVIFDPKNYQNKNFVEKIISDVNYLLKWPDPTDIKTKKNYMLEALKEEPSLIAQANACFKEGCSSDSVKVLIEELRKQKGTPGVSAALQQLSVLNGDDSIDAILALMEEATA